ncbi:MULTISPECIES: hypothetical protein [Vibrio]|uniref:hypothetical protein n=1 Tax=Vibrio TaxID=662 RepID=UPI000CE4E55A|nr:MULTISPECIES: hypothetical protein [Vibrio]MDK9770064.1 hypothetical protein [Vibrio sp. B181a]PQJ47687.1 hypothetical protein BTO01_28290 [Vibrio jasicida]
MLSILFAKSHCADPHQLVGQPIDAHTHIKAVKVYRGTAKHTLFAALIDAPTPITAPIPHAEFEGFAIHSVMLRPRPSKKTMLTPYFDACGRQQQGLSHERKRNLKRRRQKDKMTALSEQSWTRFIKPKHILKAYEQSFF